MQSILCGEENKMFNFKSVTAIGWLLVLAILTSLNAGCSSSQQRVAPEPEVSFAERLQAVLDQAVADGLPGVALAIIGADVSFTGVAGLEDTASATPLSKDHRFYLASIGKTYTSVAIVRLAGDGLLHLDDPITDWLPVSITDRIPSADAISVRNLLNHTSGIFDYQNDGDDGAEWEAAFIPDPERQWMNADVLPFFLGRPLNFQPGTDYRYSNSNYVLAALIAEAASGLSIQDVVRYYVLDPLELRDTLHGFEAVGIPGLAHGYFGYQGDIVDIYPWYSHYGVGDGGIQASAADLAMFARRILTSDVVLDDTLRAEFLEPSAAGDPPSTVALGIEVIQGETPDVIIYASGGKDPGARADVIHLQTAEQSITIALCASAAFDEFDILYDNFTQAVFEVLGNAGGQAQ
jgi:D-alanyl-D-alanine carboxypeptidase